MVNLRYQRYQKNKIEKELAKTHQVREKKSDVEGCPEIAPVVEEISVNAGFTAEFEKCMNVDVGPEKAPVVDISDIEKYCIETGEWGQTQQSQPGIKSPMVSQYGSTPQATQRDEVLLKFFNLFY
ncbi:hypothetical protein Hanom_Chr15g01409711 [Helianthus anomalus]